MKNKRGLSEVVTTLITILLVMVAIGIVWVVVQNILKSGTEQISLGQLTLNLKISQVKTEADGTLNVKVKRNPGAGELIGIKFVISDGTNTKVIERETEMKVLEEKTFKFNSSELEGISSVKEVSIAPIILTETRKKKILNVIDSFESNESLISIMSNETLDITPPLLTIYSPITTTYSANAINFIVTLSETGSCEYSLNSGVANISMNTSDNIRFFNSSILSGGIYTVRFYCNDSAGNRNDTESVLFSISNVEIVKSMTGLVSWWRFEGDAKDSVGSNDGTITGAVFNSSGKYGGAYQFDGVNDYINIPYSSDFDFGTGINFTISMWLKKGANNAQMWLIDRRITSGATQGFGVYNAPTSNNLSFYALSSTRYSNLQLSDTEWHHVVFTANRGVGSNFYLDNVISNTMSNVPGNYSNVTQMTIGGRSFTQPALTYNGSIDEVMIFNRSLSASEVSDLYGIDLSS